MGGRRVGWLVAPIAIWIASGPGSPVLGSDGKLEINQDCAAVGCFDGDTGGFPVQITARGSYVVTSNLSSSTAGAILIQISSPAVSLDLNGFVLRGDAPMQLGIQIFASDVEVRNGTLSSLGNGISGGSASRVVLRELDITSSAGAAINLGMVEHVQIRDSVISGNGEGIVAPGSSMLVEGCTVVGNTAGDGIRVGPRSLVADNLVSGNSGDGIEISDQGIVRGNVVVANTGFGINLFANTLVLENTVTTNGMMPFTNIEACASCTLVDNHVN